MLCCLFKVVLDDSRVSRSHCRIDIDKNGCCSFLDLGSSRGSKINGKKVAKWPLNLNDQIAIGSTILSLEVDSGGGGFFSRSSRK